MHEKHSNAQYTKLSRRSMHTNCCRGAVAALSRRCRGLWPTSLATTLYPHQLLYRAWPALLASAWTLCPAYPAWRASISQPASQPTNQPKSVTSATAWRRLVSRSCRENRVPRSPVMVAASHVHNKGDALLHCCTTGSDTCPYAYRNNKQISHRG